MILGIDAWVLGVLVVVLVVGSAVQNLVGLGLALVSAPVVTLLEPGLMPQLPLMLAATLPLLTLVESHDDIDWRGLGWALAARVPGTVVGVLLLRWFSPSALGVAVGVMVLLAVTTSLWSVRLPATAPVLALAGLVSGVTGTATSIGGPPFALVMQHRPPAQLRSTLAVFFVVGASLSLAGLGASGQLHGRTVALGVLLLPCLALGTWLGVRWRVSLPPGATRLGALAVCGGSALLLILRSLL